jgi:phosphoglycolate phosphatase
MFAGYANISQLSILKRKQSLMNNIRTIIWDWNGTLLDDADICLRAINSMLKTRNLHQLSLEEYRDVFTFPVIDYYRTVGFDFETEDWHSVAMEFISQYLSLLPSCGLAAQAVDVLSFFRRRNYQQAIISAMQHTELLKSVDALGITGFFDYIGGIGDHYGGGKLENAQNFFHTAGLSPASVVLIGDTIHDSEVAAGLNCSCILVAAGHQSKQRLIKTGQPVFNNLSEIYTYFEQ